MESDKMIEISEADFPELPEIAALEREIFPDAMESEKSGRDVEAEECRNICSKDKRRNGRLSYLLLRIRGR